MNKVSWVLLLLVIVAFAGAGFFWGQGSSAKQDMEVIEKVYNQKLDGYDKAISVLERDVDKYEKDIAKYDKELEELEKKMKKNEEELEETKKCLEKAPPEHLVNVTQRILDTEEVWLVGIKVEFSLNAFKSNTIKLVEWEDFTLFQIPTYKKDIEARTNTIVTLRNEVGSWKGMNKLLNEKYGTLENLNEDWKDYIKRQKKKSIFTTALYIGAGIAVGYMVGDLIGR